MSEKENNTDTLDIEDISGDIDIPDTLPLLPVKDIVVFPYMILPLSVGREISINAVNEALSSNRMMMLVTQKDLEVENPEPKELYNVGTVVSVIRMIKTPEDRVKILVQGLDKAEVKEYISTEPYMEVKIEKFRDDTSVSYDPIEDEALKRTVREQLQEVIDLGTTISPDILMVVDGIIEPGKLADLIISNLGMPVDSAQKVLETKNPHKRLKIVSDLLGHEIQLLSIQEKIQSNTQDEMTKSQKEYFLREQMRQIKKELGDGDDKNEEIDELFEKMRNAKMPEHALKETEKQIIRLQKMHPESAEATTVRTYIEWLLDTPWSISTEDNINIKHARKVLNHNHYDLEKIKERILEYLGVAKLKKDIKGPILCFVGPPGTGKTSLGKSIARALGRKFTRMSLGGMRDESEIRGHRRTYIGALPGRIIQGLKTAGTNNPVFVLDEIDKLGNDFRGDPSSALLEVLDPQQNNSFTDHFLGIPFDLSKVLFIATANWMDPIPAPLRDRMEIIQLAGYTEEEKLHIAIKYLIKRQVEENGLSKKDIIFDNNSIKEIINKYTREPGLRNLEREIATVCRKVALKIAQRRPKDAITITAKTLSKYLGTPKYLPESEKEKPQIGVATGLAWTSVGGVIMHVEVTTMKGRGQLTLTGKLGDVMRESAQAAYSYCRTNAKKLGISEDFVKTTDIHVHVPAGATPKDGPSAGITIATALASALSGRPVRNDIAMTGEITLRGRVLPIGGLKEKTLAALQAGIKTIIIPFKNKSDLADIPNYAKKKLKFIPVKDASMVLKIALEPATVQKSSKSSKKSKTSSKKSVTKSSKTGPKKTTKTIKPTSKRRGIVTNKQISP